MCADSFPVNQFMSAPDCSHTRHSWPLIIWSGYFRKLLCTCFLFPATRDSVDMQWMQLRRRCLVQYLQSMLVVTFSEVLLARSLQKKIRNKRVVSKPTTINYRRSIKLSDSDFFWSFIFTSSNQMSNLRLLVRKVLGIEITLEKRCVYNGQW